jgi:hypothetical protein
MHTSASAPAARGAAGFFFARLIVHLSFLEKRAQSATG